jgi:hypothetical protein
MDQVTNQVDVSVALTLNADSTIASIIFSSPSPMTEDGFLNVAKKYISGLEASIAARVAAETAKEETNGP